MPTPGARRAGQDREAPEGSLDAPKRSRTISKRERPVPLPGGCSCPDRRALPLHQRGTLTRTKSCLDVDPGSSHDLGPDFHDKPGRAETPTSGRERLRGAGLGPSSRSTSGVAHALLMLPHRGPGKNGRHTTPPFATDSRRGNMSIHKRLQHLAVGAVAKGHSCIDVTRMVGGGPPAASGDRVRGSLRGLRLA
jgi:hypothetical protein